MLPVQTSNLCRVIFCLTTFRISLQATGKHIVYNEVDNEVFSRVAGRRVIGTLCRVICERNKPFLEARATGSSKKLTTKIQAFEDWAKRQVKQGGGQWDQLR